MIWSLPSNRIRPHLLGGFELFKDTHCDRTQSDHAWDCGPFPHYRPGRHTGIGINVPFENGFFTCVQYPHHRDLRLRGGWCPPLRPDERRIPFLSCARVPGHDGRHTRQSRRSEGDDQTGRPISPRHSSTRTRW